MRPALRPIAAILAGSGLLVVPLRAQQTAVAKPTTSASSTEVASNAATPDRAVVFEDRAASGGFDARKWAALAGEPLATGGGSVVRIGCEGPDGAAALLTRPISLSNLLSATVTIDALPAGDPPPGPLVIEWSDEQADWRPLALIDAQQGGLRSFDLPPSALDGTIRIRIAPSGGGGWLVRSFVVSGSPTTSWSRIRIDSQPLEGGLFSILTESVLAERSVASPAMFFTAARSVRLIAPADIGGRPFLRWDLGPARASESKRGVLQNADSGQPAVAHYAADPDESRIATITLDTLPADGAHFAVAFADDPTFVIEPVYPGGSMRFLVGESALIAAPPRFGRMVFSHWSLDGRPVGNDAALLTLAIERSGELLAAYELLGDMNDDDVLDKSDVELFILALADPTAYQQRYPTVDRLRRGDINGDGQLDLEDVRSFVELVLAE